MKCDVYVVRFYTRRGAASCASSSPSSCSASSCPTRRRRKPPRSPFSFPFAVSSEVRWRDSISSTRARTLSSCGEDQSAFLRNDWSEAHLVLEILFGANFAEDGQHQARVGLRERFQKGSDRRGRDEAYAYVEVDVHVNCVRVVSFCVWEWRGRDSLMLWLRENCQYLRAEARGERLTDQDLRYSQDVS